MTFDEKIQELSFEGTTFKNALIDVCDIAEIVETWMAELGRPKFCMADVVAMTGMVMQRERELIQMKRDRDAKMIPGSGVTLCDAKTGATIADMGATLNDITATMDLVMQRHRERRRTEGGGGE